MTAVGPLVGREHELARLAEAATTAARYAPTLLVVEGEAGIGKTTLVRRLMDEQAASGATVLAGACSPGARDLPFHGWAGVLRGTASPTILAGDAAAGSRGQVLASVTQELLELSRQRRVTVVLEDLHWADESTLDLVDYLVRSSRQERLLVAVTVRTADPAHELVRDRLAELSRLPCALVVRPGRLDPHDVSRQIEMLTGVTPDPAVLPRIVERSGGVPLLVAELVAADGSTSVAQDLVGHRVRSLPGPGRVVAEAAAVGGAVVDEDVLFHVAGLAEDDFDTGVRSALTSGVLEQVAPDRVGFRHELLREATLDALAPRRRRALHGRWAEALVSTRRSARDGHAATLAAHWTAAGDDQQALPALVQAADEADRVFAHRERLRLLLAAAEAWDRVDSAERVSETDLATVLADAAEMAQLLGEHDVARDLVDRGHRLLARPEDGPRRAWFDVVDMWIRWHDGRTVPVQEVRQVVATLRRRPAHRHVVRGLFALHSSLLQDGRPDEALGVVQEARSLADALGDRTLQAEVAGVLAHLLAATGDYEEAVRCAEQERAHADELGDPYLRAEAMVTASVVLWEAGDVAGALAASERGRDLMGGRRPGPVPHEWALNTCNAVEGLLDLGHWDQASDWIDHVLGAADLLTPATVGFAERLRYWLDVVRGQGEQWRAWLREPAPDVTSLWIQDAAASATSLVDMCCHSGLHDPGRYVAARMLEQDRMQTAIPAFVWPLLAVSSRNEVEAVGVDLREPPVTDRIRTLARVVPAPNPVLQAHASQVAADLARLHGEPDLDLYRDAAEHWQRLGMPYWQAWALLRVGESAARDGHRDDARSALLRAAGIARDLRAAPLSRRIETASRAHRIRGVTATDASAATSAGLTRREVEVLHLLDEGASNRGIAQRLVISEKTVSVHVSHLMAKLHAGSRGEAVAAARQAGLLDDPV